MSNIGIYGMGVIGGFGCGKEALSDALHGSLKGELPALQDMKAGRDDETTLPSLMADLSPLRQHFKPMKLRRVDRFSQMALLTATECLGETTPLAGDDTALLLASGYGAAKATFGFLDTSRESAPSPTHFANSVHNSATSTIAIFHKLKGPCCSVSQFEMSFASAMASARAWLESGKMKSVMVIAADEYCEVNWNSRLRFFGQPEGELAPHDSARHTAIPGEGAACFLLERCDDRDTPPPYGYLTHASVTRDGKTPQGWQADDNQFAILGLDGHKVCHRFYTPWADMKQAAYSRLFGSLPTSQALDMAVACTAIKENKCIPTPGDKTGGSNAILQKSKPLNGKTISCIKHGRRGELALVDIAAQPPIKG
jgi:3-oxoacyl-[acyl-carrier-protein] synthase II